MIGVDVRYAGRGYGGDLFVDALIRIMRAVENIGIAMASSRYSTMETETYCTYRASMPKCRKLTCS